MAMHEHVFYPPSGYCPCGYRDDGRLLNRDGIVYQTGPEYTPAELYALLTKDRP